MIQKLKTLAAISMAAITLSVPFFAEAHFLSSKQEKEIGNAAVKDFIEQYGAYEEPVLTAIQDRIMRYNSDRLWFYGSPGHKRGLERVLCTKKPGLNAVSYGGGQIFVYDDMIDFLASDEPGSLWDKRYAHIHNKQWTSKNIYQMSSLASVIGHEIGHWENEDMLRQHDKQMTTRIITSVIPVGNVWALLGVAAGSKLIDAFNSRQMGFRVEQQADEKAMEYLEMVPEYSIGGLAIQHRRLLLYKIDNGIEDKVENWLHPHSKTGKRIERALKEMEKSSRGFLKWEGMDLRVNNAPYAAEGNDYYDNPAVVDGFERELYFAGQLATAIKYDFARERNLSVSSEQTMFEDGDPNNTCLLVVGRGTDGKDHIKLLDTFYGLSTTEAQKMLNKGGAALRAEIKNFSGERENFAHAVGLVNMYEENLNKYGPRGANADKYEHVEDKDGQDD